MTEEREFHFVQWDDNPNIYIDAAELNDDQILHFHVFRTGQTVEEYLAEMEAARVREQHGLPPGRTMPTAEEIAAGPPPPPPEPVLIPYVAFEDRWEPGELAALHAARAAHWEVDRYVTRATMQGHINLTGIDDPEAETMAKAAKALFVQLGVLTAERAAVVFAAP